MFSRVSAMKEKQRQTREEKEAGTRNGGAIIESTVVYYNCTIVCIVPNNVIFNCSKTCGYGKSSKSPAYRGYHVREKKRSAPLQGEAGDTRGLKDNSGCVYLHLRSRKKKEKAKKAP